jgi:deazaflavin-dependent oxidoreductase (nitroreductase family)
MLPIAVAAVVAVLLLLTIAYRVVRMAHSRPRLSAAGPHSHSHGPVQRTVLRAVTTVIRGLLRLGVRFGPMMMLTVPGRTTGLPRTNPVDLFQQAGRSWLVATHTGGASWVRNLRAAGTGELSRGRTRLNFTAVELPHDEAAVMLRDVIGPRLARPLAGFVLRQAIDVAPDAPLADFAQVSTNHPVFALTITATNRNRVPAATGNRRVMAAALMTGGTLLALAHVLLGVTGLMTTTQWASGLVIGLLLTGLGNHLRIFGSR